MPLYDSGESDGVLYFVMPYVEGASLRDRIAREGRIPVGEALDIARAVAGALDYAHRHDIVGGVWTNVADPDDLSTRCR